MHVFLRIYRIHILLNNDYPLPKHLLSPNSSGRFVAVLSRKARVQLSDCLKHFCSFVLLDNTTFIKFIYETNEGEKSASDSDAEGNLLSNDKADYVMVSASTFLLFNVDCYFLFFCRSAANSVMSMSECLTCQDI